MRCGADRLVAVTHSSKIRRSHFKVFQMITLIIFVVGAYLLGSVSFAVLMSKAFGLADPRSYGSGNPGATNVLRSGKKAAAALTLLGDAAKGWLAVFLAIHFAPHDGEGLLIVALVALAVFLGHVFPVFLKFKGGKGVATALGVLLALNIWMGLAVFATWLLVAVVFRYSSLSALVAAIAAPIFAMLVHLRPELVLATAIMSMLLIWRHKSNIQNLMAGKESKIGGKKKEEAQSA
jgi:glycerol-3-phosphate acyltransferase PlsY